MRNQVVKLSKQLRGDFYNKRIQDQRNSKPHEWWRETKRLNGQSTKSALISIINSIANSDTQLPGGTINNSLQQVTSDQPPLSTEHVSEIGNVADEQVIEPSNVFNKLLRIRVHKSPGPEGIPNWVLRDFAFAIADPMCHIFNECIMPGLWKRANVVPLLKSYSPKCFSVRSKADFTSTISKLPESRIDGWPLDIEYKSEKLYARQFGALRGRSTTHALTSATHVASSTG
jgi:hypothetical protein